MKSNSKDNFVEGQIFSLTLMATTQRAHPYIGGTSEVKKNMFRVALQRKLKEFSNQYEIRSVEAKAHIEPICLQRGFI